MYLIDTNIISEIRKGKNANSCVKSFFADVVKKKSSCYLSVVTIGELRRGIEMIRYRNDDIQASILEKWLQKLLSEYSDNILPFAIEDAQLWGYLRVPHHENLLDKQIAATALINDLTLVTRNVSDFIDTKVKLLNPFNEK